MPETEFPLARAAIDRDAAARSDPDLLRTLVADPGTRLLLVHRGLVPVGEAARLITPTVGEFRAVAGDAVVDDLPLAYLGRGEAGSYLAGVLGPGVGDPRDFGRGEPDDSVPPPVAGARWASLREVGDAFGESEAGLAVAAVALAAWHARHPRCVACGSATDPVDAGWARRCRVCGALHHPRTDPAIIVVVTDDADRLLLAHAAPWPARRFSLVAGFVEAGEALEAAVRREVAEECGLTVRDVRYLGSQPWPFPASLMVAFRARTADGVPRPDGSEVTEARFVTRPELAAAAAGGEILLPMRASIARVLIEDWFGGPLP